MSPPKAATANKADIAAPLAPSRGSEELISGSEAIAHAVQLADVDVITAYPIRPYDTVMQYVSQLIADGDFDCDSRSHPTARSIAGRYEHRSCLIDRRTSWHRAERSRSRSPPSCASF